MQWLVLQVTLLIQCEVVNYSSYGAGKVDKCPLDWGC